MANMKLKTEGGQGGKLGHSNMVHYAKTEEVKAAARRQRRQEGKKTLVQELKTLDEYRILAPRVE